MSSVRNNVELAVLWTWLAVPSRFLWSERFGNSKVHITELLSCRQFYFNFLPCRMCPQLPQGWKVYSAILPMIVVFRVDQFHHLFFPVQMRYCNMRLTRFDHLFSFFMNKFVQIRDSASLCKWNLTTMWQRLWLISFQEESFRENWLPTAKYLKISQCWCRNSTIERSGTIPIQFKSSWIP